jgi:hypothetical protein
MRNYIGINGIKYSSIEELTKANREVKNNPIYIKEMRRRALVNIPGEITREDWQKLLKIYGENKELEEANVKTTRVEPVNYMDQFEKESKKEEKPVEKKEPEKNAEPKAEAKPVKEEEVVEKKKYASYMSDERRKLLKRANAKKMEFDLTEEQVSSLLEKKCHFCSTKSETLITVGDKFDYPNARPVCGTCKRVHDVLGDEMQEYVDRLIQD